VFRRLFKHSAPHKEDAGLGVQRYTGSRRAVLMPHVVKPGRCASWGALTAADRRRAPARSGRRPTVPADDILTKFEMEAVAMLPGGYDTMLL
jgi:hypothetical protein